jgi:hypothetical protein
VPEAKGGKMYRNWIALNFHTTRRYMKLLEIGLSLDLRAMLLNGKTANTVEEKNI